MVIDETQRHSFYEAALRALRFVDARAPSKRRFGPEADAMWKNFKGHLTAADRVDILLRDADIETGGAFGARVAFAMKGVAEDDAFGAEWQPLVPRIADELYRAVTAEDVATGVDVALAGCAGVWSLSTTSKVSGLEASIKPADKILVTGPSAIIALVARFEGQEALSFADQVTCIATPTGHRQVASLAAALLRGRRPPRLLRHEDVFEEGFDRASFSGFMRVQSDDADVADRNAFNHSEGF